MSKKRHQHRAFSDDEQLELAKVIRSLVPLAGNEGHFLHKWARANIGGLLWCWTAGAISLRSGRVASDAFKYNVDIHPATQRATKMAGGKSNKGLRHEHVVPRNVLAKRIVADNMDEYRIVEFLRVFCRAVIIDKDDDNKFSKGKLGKSMPKGWEWDPNDVYARYKKLDLLDNLVWPTRNSEIH